MNCLSCKEPVSVREARVQAGIFLCRPCADLAEKLEGDIRRELNRVAELANAWLREYVLTGGLLRGGSGFDVPVRVGSKEHT